jgi:hypothetical protein
MAVRVGKRERLVDSGVAFASCAPVHPRPVYDGHMSLSIGRLLDERLLALLGAEDLGALMGHAIAIATLDGEGRPHPALLSFGEVRAFDRSTLRIATWDDTRTTENLRSRGAITLFVVEAGFVAYLKGRAEEMARPRAVPGLARFGVQIEDILVDEVDETQEQGARVTSGIRFEPTRWDRKLDEWRAVHAALGESA